MDALAAWRLPPVVLIVSKASAPSNNNNSPLCADQNAARRPPAPPPTPRPFAKTSPDAAASCAAISAAGSRAAREGATDARVHPDAMGDARPAAAAAAPGRRPADGDDRPRGQTSSDHRPASGQRDDDYAEDSGRDSGSEQHGDDSEGSACDSKHYLKLPDVEGVGGESVRGHEFISRQPTQICEDTTVNDESQEIFALRKILNNAKVFLDRENKVSYNSDSEIDNIEKRKYDKMADFIETDHLSDPSVDDNCSEKCEHAVSDPDLSPTSDGERDLAVQRDREASETRDHNQNGRAERRDYRGAEARDGASAEAASREGERAAGAVATVATVATVRCERGAAERPDAAPAAPAVRHAFVVTEVQPNVARMADAGASRRQVNGGARPLGCPLNWGRPETGCTWRGPVAAMRPHLEACHPRRFSEFADPDASAVVWEISQAGCFRDYTHVVFAFGEAFVYHKRFNMRDRKLYFAVALVSGARPGAPEFRYKYKTTRQAGRQRLSLSAAVHSVDDDVEATLLSGATVAVDFDTLVAFGKGAQRLFSIRRERGPGAGQEAAARKSQALAGEPDGTPTGSLAGAGAATPSGVRRSEGRAPATFPRSRRSTSVDDKGARPRTRLPSAALLAAPDRPPPAEAGPVAPFPRSARSATTSSCDSTIDV